MIKSLRLQNFRLYTDATYEFKPGANIIVGPNGAGKTSILEGIYATLRGNSWRASDEVLIRHGEEWARVDIEDEDKNIYSILLDNRTNNLQKTRLINGEKSTDSLPSVLLFEPDFIRTLTGSPELRRSWLDEAISQGDRSYPQALKNYKRALYQRNQLLKQPQVANDHVFVWNLKLSEFGSIVAQTRAVYIEALAPLLQQQYQTISQTDHVVSIKYQPQFTLHAYSTQHLKRLERDFHKDRERGFTTSGPHREDTLLTIRNKLIEEEASRGEIKSIALGLKLSELEYLDSSETIILLDELYEELDDTRRSAISRLGERQHLATSIKMIGKNTYISLG